jgi:N-acetyl-anhydromuramyl-L-alanine amidase AmpD
MKIIETRLKFKRKLKKLNSPSMIVIHHAAHSSATVKDIHRWHLKNGWSRFGYHFLVTKDGQVYRGRPEDAMGAHCKSYNNISLGVCMQGNYDVEKISEIQFKSLIGLCRYLCNKYSINAIKGHRELNATRFTGLNFPLTELRQTVFGTYDTYTVKPGDTLWSIARHYNLTILRLMEINGLNGSLIYLGQILKIM